MHCTVGANMLTFCTGGEPTHQRVSNERQWALPLEGVALQGKLGWRAWPKGAVHGMQGTHTSSW